MKITTNGDFVSVIRHDLKALNKDDYVSARYILASAYSYIEYIVNNRQFFKLFRDGDIFTICSCIPMKQVKKYECPDLAEFRNCDKISKSKSKLPKIISSRFGNTVQYVMNIVNGEEFYPLRHAADYNNSKKRQFGHLFKYYYIDGDNYLYLLNSTAEAVNMSAAFLGECEDCEKGCDECKSKLEEKFVAPSEFHSTIIEQTLNKILNGNKKIIEDDNPDLSTNQKTRTK